MMKYNNGKYRYDDMLYIDEEMEDLDEWATVFFDTFDEAVEYAKKSMETPDEVRIDPEKETACFYTVDHELSCGRAIEIGRNGS